MIHPQSVRRLLCNARVQTVVEDRNGTVLGIGRLSRQAPAWMVRQVRHRDRECRFPGCGARRFTEPITCGGGVTGEEPTLPTWR